MKQILCCRRQLQDANLEVLQYSSTLNIISGTHMSRGTHSIEGMLDLAVEQEREVII